MDGDKPFSNHLENVGDAVSRYFTSLGYEVTSGSELRGTYYGVVDEGSILLRLTSGVDLNGLLFDLPFFLSGGKPGQDGVEYSRDASCASRLRRLYSRMLAKPPTREAVACASAETAEKKVVPVSGPDLITEMLRANGQATAVESPVARMYMGRVLDLVRPFICPIVAADIERLRVLCDKACCRHSVPRHQGTMLGVVCCCDCGAVSYRWGWADTSSGSGQQQLGWVRQP